MALSRFYPRSWTQAAGGVAGRANVRLGRESSLLHAVVRVSTARTTYRPDDSSTVATAIYSVTMVLWKETAFPPWRAIGRRWKRNVVSSGVFCNSGDTRANLTAILLFYLLFTNKVA